MVEQANMERNLYGNKLIEVSYLFHPLSFPHQIYEASLLWSLISFLCQLFRTKHMCLFIYFHSYLVDVLRSKKANYMSSCQCLWYFHQTRPNHTTYDNFNKVMSKEGNSHKFLALTAFFWSEKWQFIFRDGTFLKWITRSTSNVAPSWQSRKYSPTFLKYSSWSRVFSFSCFTACFADLVHWLYRKCATYGPIYCKQGVMKGVGLNLFFIFYIELSLFQMLKT